MTVCISVPSLSLQSIFSKQRLFIFTFHEFLYCHIITLYGSPVEMNRQGLIYKEDAQWKRVNMDDETDW